MGTVISGIEAKTVVLTLRKNTMSYKKTLPSYGRVLLLIIIVMEVMMYLSKTYMHIQDL